jgi:hypothetical protein
MNPLDDLFRDGLGGRKGDIPDDMWARVNASRTPVIPEGEGVDQYFSDALKDHRGEVPADMWSRISAGGVPAPASLDQTFADGLRGLTGAVPIGMWDKIWRVRTAIKFPVAARWAAAASILLLFLAGLWLLDRQVNQAGGPSNMAVAAESPSETDEANITTDDLTVDDDTVGAAAGISTPLIRPAKKGGGAIPPTATAVASTAGQPDTREIKAHAEEELEYVATPVINEAISADPSGANTESAADTPGGLETPAAPEDRQAIRREAVPAATPSLVFAPQALAIIAVEVPAFSVKKHYLPRRDELSTETFRAAPRHRLQAEFLFGAFYANQQFRAMSDDQLIPREIRNLNENPDLSYQVTLRGSYNLNRHFHLLGGLTYAEIRNEFAYTQVIGGQSRDIRTTNRLRMLEVPLLLGLRLPGRRMMVSLNAGPVVNLAFSARGRFVHPDAPEPLSLAEAGNYRSNLGVGFMSSLSINYKVGRKDPFVLLVEPFFKGYPTSFTVKDAPLQESYWAAGIQFGVRKGF